MWIQLNKLRNIWKKMKESYYFIRFIDFNTLNQSASRAWKTIKSFSSRTKLKWTWRQIAHERLLPLILRIIVLTQFFHPRFRNWLINPVQSQNKKFSTAARFKFCSCTTQNFIIFRALSIHGVNESITLPLSLIHLV